MALPALTDQQADVVLAILEGADPNNGQATTVTPVALLDVLRSYERTLPKFGLQTKSDSFYYRFLLQLSLNSAPSWWEKLVSELQKAGHYVDPRFRVKAASMMSPAASPFPRSFASPTSVNPMASDPSAFTPSVTASFAASGAPSIAPLLSGGLGDMMRGSEAVGTMSARSDGSHASIVMPSTSPYKIIANTVHIHGDGNAMTSMVETSKTHELAFTRQLQSAALRETEPLAATAINTVQSPSFSMKQELYDAQTYGNFGTMARAFRRWVAAVVYAREERKLAGEVNEIKVAAALATRQRRMLHYAFQSLARGCRSLQVERQATLKAVSHWSARLQARTLRGWRRVVVSSRPTPQYHPQQIRATFKWIALTLPDRGEWWRLAATHASMNVATPRTFAGSGELAPHLEEPDGIAFRHDPISTSTYQDFQRYANGVATPHRSRPSSEPRRNSPGQSYSGRRAASLSPDRSQPLLFTGESPRRIAANMAATTQAREQRLGRLRSYVVSRITPPWRKLPLLEHATAIVDADMVIKVFSGWYKAARATQIKSVRINRFLARSAVRRWKRNIAKSATVTSAYRQTAAMHNKYELARAWFAWRREYYDRLHVERNRSLCDQFHGTWTLKHTFAKWKKYRAFVHRLQHRAQYHRVSLMHLVMRAWVVFTARQVAATLRIKRMSAILRRNALARNMHTWKESLRLKDRFVHATKHFEFTCMARLFNTWRAGALLQSRLDDDATQRMRNLLRRQWWTRWAQSHHLQRVLAGKMHARKIKAMQRVIFCWKTRVAAQIAARTQCVNAETALMRTKLHSAVCSWRHTSGSIARLRSCSSALALTISRRRTLLVLRGWRAALHAKMRMYTVVKRFHHLKLHRSVQHWRDIVTAMTHARRTIFRVCMHLRNRSVSRAFHALKHNVAAQQKSRDIQRKVITMFKNAALGRCIRQWRGTVRDKHRVVSISAQAVRRMFQLTLHRGFSAWKRFVEERKHQREVMRRVLNRMMDVQLARAVRSWQLYAANVKHTRAIMSHVISRMRSHQAHMAVTTWRERVKSILKARRTMLRVVQSFQDSRLIRAVRQWRELVSSKRKAQRTMRAAVGVLTNAKLFASVRKWHDVAHKHRQAKVLITRTLLAMQQVLAGKAFRKWCDYARHKVLIRDTQNKCVEELSHRHLLQSVHTWHSFAQASRKAKAVRAKTVAIMKMRLGSAAFNTWVALVHNRRLLADSAEQMCHRKLVELLRRSFNAWKGRAHRTARIKKLATTVIMRMQQLEQVTAVHRWHQLAQQGASLKKKAAAVRAYVRRLALAHGIRNWRMKYRCRQRIQLLLPTVVTAIRRGLLRTAMVRLTSHSHRVAVIEAACQTLLNHRFTDLRASLFAAWRAYYTRKRQLRSLTQEAIEILSSTAARRAVRAWLEGSVHNNRVRQLQQKTERRVLHQYLGAWRAWSVSRKDTENKGIVLASAIFKAADYSILRTTFGAWHSLAATDASRKRLRDRISTQCARGNQRVCLDKWRELFLVLQLHRRKTAARAFTGLEKMIHRKKCQAIIVQRVRSNTITAYFHAWIAEMREEKSTSAAASRLVQRMAGVTGRGRVPLQALARWKNLSLASAFAAMKAYHQHRQCMRQTKLAADRVSARFGLRQALRAWQSSFQDELKWRCAAAHRTRRVLRKAFHTLRVGCRFQHNWRIRKAHQGKVADDLLVRHRLARSFLGFMTIISHIRSVHSRLVAVQQTSNATAASKLLHTMINEAKRNRNIRDTEVQLVVTRRVAALRDAITVWNDFAAARAKQKKLVVGHIARSGRRRALTAWLHYTAEGLRRKAIHAKADDMVTGTGMIALQTVFSQWLQQARHRGDRREASQILQRVCAQHRMHRAFSSWITYKKMSIAKRLGIALAIQQNRRHQLRSNITRWLSCARRRTALQSAGRAIAIGSQKMLQRSFLLSWYSALVAKRAQRNTLSNMLARLTAHNQRLAFDLWRSRSRFLTNLRALTMRNSSRRAFETLAFTLEAWTSFTRQRVILHTAESLTAARHRDNMVHSALLQWVHHTRQERRERDAVLHIQAHVALSAVSTSFRTWLELSRSRRRLLAAATQFVRNSMTRSVRNILQNWSETAVEQRRDTVADQFRVRRALLSVVSSWKQKAYLQKAFRSLGANLARTTSKACLNAWWTCMIRQRANRLHGIFVQRHLRNSICIWQSDTAFAKRSQDAALKFEAYKRATSKLAAVRYWKTHTHLEKISRAAVEARRDWSMRVAFDAVKAYAIHRQSKQLRAHNVMEIMRLRGEQRTLHAWHQVVSDAKRFRQALAAEQELRMRVDRRMQVVRFRQLHKVWRAWNQFTQLRKKSKQLALRFSVNMLVRPFLSHWQTVAHRSSRLAHCEQLVRCACQRRELQGSWRTMLSTYQQARKAAYLDQILSTVHEHGRRLVLKTVFAEMTRSLKKSQAREQAVELHKECYMRKIMKNWMQLAVATRFYKQSLCTQSFGKWQQMARIGVASRQAAAAEFARRKCVLRLRHCIATWHETMKFTTVRKQRLAHASMITQNIRRERKLRDTARALFEVTRQTASAKEFHSRLLRRRAHTSILQWRKVCSKRSYELLLEKRAVNFYRRRMLAVTFTTWKGQSYRSPANGVHGFTFASPIANIMQEMPTAGMRGGSSAFTSPAVPFSTGRSRSNTFMTPAAAPSTTPAARGLSATRTPAQRPMVPVVPPAIHFTTPSLPLQGGIKSMKLLAAALDSKHTPAIRPRTFPEKP